MVESFKAAGIENFHMKAAVPGTEIPGHKVYLCSTILCPIIGPIKWLTNGSIKFPSDEGCVIFLSFFTLSKLQPATSFLKCSKLKC